MEAYMPDTSAVIEGLLTSMVERGEIKGKILIHKAVIAELEHQANYGKEIGFLGLEEIKDLRELAQKKGIKVEYVGERPSRYQIRGARAGEIDAMIREAAWENGATLITCDTVQAETAKAIGMKVIFIKKVKRRRKLLLEKFFDEETMSVHLKEKTVPFAKKGKPGSWRFVKLSKKMMSHKEILEIAKQIIEMAKMTEGSFVEVERKGSTIVQLGPYRVIITWPPFSDGLEITAVRPIRKLSLEEYGLDPKLMERLEKKAEGILIAGEPGAGKSTFAQALAEFYASKDKIVKTVEAPRDLQLPPEITQYSKNIGTSDEIHDILLLSRPDYTIFDEMRNTPDFKLYTDMRLAGVGMVGVVHATTPIDAIQRFIGRVELGMIPSIIDTVIFIKDGEVQKVYELKMTVKVPTGMTEADLARPVIEVRDFLTGQLEYELYSFGEETAVVPIVKERSRARELASKTIEREMRRLVRGEVKVEVPSDRKAVVYVEEKEVPKLIGRKGKRIASIEKKLGMSVDVRPLEKERIDFDVEIGNKNVIVYVEPGLVGKNVEIWIDGKKVFESTVGKKGMIRIRRRSEVGEEIVRAFKGGREIKVVL